MLYCTSGWLTRATILLWIVVTCAGLVLYGLWWWCDVGVVFGWSMGRMVYEFCIGIWIFMCACFVIVFWLMLWNDRWLIVEKSRLNGFEITSIFVRLFGCIFKFFFVYCILNCDLFGFYCFLAWSRFLKYNWPYLKLFIYNFSVRVKMLEMFWFRLTFETNAKVERSNCFEFKPNRKLYRSFIENWNNST